MKLSGIEMSYTWPVASNIHETVRYWNVIHMTCSMFTDEIAQEAYWPIVLNTVLWKDSVSSTQLLLCSLLAEKDCHRYLTASWIWLHLHVYVTTPFQKWLHTKSSCTGYVDLACCEFAATYTTICQLLYITRNVMYISYIAWCTYVNCHILKCHIHAT